MSENIQVPKGWEVIEFCNIANLRNKKYIPNQNENIKCIELECIEKENGNLLYCINSNTQKSTKNYFYKNDVLYGKLRPYLKKYFYATFDGVCSTEIWVFNATNKIDSYYLFLIIQSNKFNHYTNISTGTRMPRADWNIVSNLPVLLPPLEEQKKIAEILSLWDKAIEQTKELIAYKEKQKKGLMQALLTGKKRLNGFTDEWKTYQLGDIFQITSAGVDKKILEDEIKVHLLNYIDIYNNNIINNGTTNFITTAPKNKILNCNILKGDVFLTPSSETREDIAHSAVATEDLINTVYSYHIMRLRPKIQINILFSKYMFDNDYFRQQVYSLCDGSGQRYVLSINIVKNLELIIPTSVDEQKAIADILSNADEEINLLNKQLELYTEQKKGLMQNLLTGKVRV